MNNDTIVAITTVTALLIGVAVYFSMGNKNSGSSSAKIAATPSPPSDGTSTSTSTVAGGTNRSRLGSQEDKYPAGRMNVFFGSQTGTAEGFARIVQSEGQKKGFDAKLLDLEDFDAELLTSPDTKLSVFMVATYGEGDPTDNAAKFYEWLKNGNGELADNFLASAKFCVFGLGNKDYESYNKMGRDVDAMLAKLGGIRVFEYGEGDDSGTLEEDFEKWRAMLWPAITQQFNPNAQSSAVEEANEKVNLKFRCVSSKSSKAKMPPVNQIQNSTKFFFSAPSVRLTTCAELRSDAASGSTVHIEVDIKGTGLSYQTADNLAVLHENTSEVVEQFALTCGGFNLDECVALEPSEDADDFKHPFPSPCSVRHLLTHYVDLQAIPRRGVLAQLGAYLSDKQQKQWLQGITSMAQKDAFAREIEQEGRSYASLLGAELSSCVAPLEDLLHILPTIQPRDYTIASSSSVHPTSIHLTVSVTQRISPSGATVEGLCSNFLKRLISTGSQTCKVFVRESSFRLPKSLNTPVIMVGPGSGIAPMRALLQERKHQAAKQNNSEAVNVLYFGCRARETDFLYREELEAAQNEGTLTSLQVAFSREQAEKVYVQDLIRRPENASYLCKLIVEQGAFVFVCGATAMGQSVLEAFAEILAAEKGVSTSAGHDLIKDMQKKHTYVQELWST